MGQILGAIQDKFQGRQWRERQVRKITDKVYDRFKDAPGKSTDEGLTFEDVYIAVLEIYNDINKYLPGPHHDPPSKEKLQLMIDEYDFDLNNRLDREEFAEFIRKLTADSLSNISLKLAISFVAAPLIALMTKRATERVPGLGPVVQRLPNSIYASIIAVGVVLAQRSGDDCV
ncbi:Calcium-binding EF hand family protein [Rhynchospora pubera]|uniref:Calcium-binding EF hand family protein n=1 Tax=Rhynchospora pubera TaxID=906938 RepID=A0AAV8CVC9_9POAL|nr:Calcium-binding EF hand family protein [Rhynchospora pubera]